MDTPIPSGTEQEAILSLVRRCAGGEDAALREFFETYSKDIYNFPMRVFHLDEDGASDFYLYALEILKNGNRFKSFSGRSTFRTWFYSVLRNLVIDWLRITRFQRKPSQPLLEAADQPVPEEEPLVQDWLGGLPLETRCLVKLVFVYYLEMDAEELAHVCDRSGLNKVKLAERIASIKAGLAEKEIENLSRTDKITSLYVGILDLRSRRARVIEEDTQHVRRHEVERIDHAIAKKTQQREKLLARKEKGHFVVRLPYREAAELLAMPEGSVSVAVMRAFEKLREMQKKLTEGK